MQIENRLTVWPMKSDGLGRLLHLGILKDFAWGVPGAARTMEYFALVYVVEGACRYTYLDQPKHPQCTIASGEAFLLFPGVPHVYKTLDGKEPGTPWTQIYISFEGPVFDVWRNRRLLDPDRRIFKLTPIDYWLGRFEALVHAFPPDDGGDMHGICALQSLLADILAQTPGRRSSTEESRWLRQARSALEAVGRADALDLYAIADQMNTSYAYFRRKFTRLAKASPGKYHATMLMRRACQIMQERKITDRELTEELGYLDAFRFSQRFRQIIGVTPRQFRGSVIGKK